MLFFVSNDLIFDFLFDFESSNYISFACTLIAALIVFYCNFAIRKNKITAEFENAASFIKSNFDNWQVAFSILDIICGIISLLSGLAFLTVIFKIIKVTYVPLKIIVVTNKSKSIVKAVSKVGLLWTAGRLLSSQNCNGENKGMFKKIGLALKNLCLWIYSNKKSIIGTLASIVAGVTTAMVAYEDTIVTLPELIVFDINIVPYIAGLVIFGLTELGVTGKGFETIKEFFARIKANKEQKKAEKAAKVEQKQALEAEKAMKAQEKQQANENKKAERLLKKLEAEEKALREKKAIADAKKAEEERLLQKALALKAEREKSNTQN